MPKQMSYKNLSGICWVVWTMFLVFLTMDGFRIWGGDIGFVESLKTSSLARGIFFDIGIFSSIFAVWIVFFTKEKYRYFFALVTILFGSIGLLPFLAIYFKNKADHES